MILDARKKRILQAIINDYIDTAEPVGSRTIAKKYDLGLSSATIRNEMADLEEMGFLKQPHTSAGRIPSHPGYRIYVDELMGRYRMSVTEALGMKKALEAKIDKLDRLIEMATYLVSEFTCYTSVITPPKMNKSSVKYLKLVLLEKNKILLVLVVSEGMVKNKQIKTMRALSEQVLEKMTNILNQKIAGLIISEISMKTIEAAMATALGGEELIWPIYELILECVDQFDSNEVYMGGASNIFNFPEYCDIDKARSFLSFIESKSNLTRLLRESDRENEEIVISIGRENHVTQMDDCSVITSKYYLNNKVGGTVGLIGPVRMDYAKAVSVLQSISVMLNKKMKQILNDDYEG